MTLSPVLLAQFHLYHLELELRASGQLMSSKCQKVMLHLHFLVGEAFNQLKTYVSLCH